jgi:hypothetical protein
MKENYVALSVIFQEAWPFTTRLAFLSPASQHFAWQE